MASRQGLGSKKLGLGELKATNSPSSSTTSSSKQFMETSIDGQSSPASSSARSKPHCMYSDNVETERYKESVTVTVRFRPLSPREIQRGEEIAWYADGETILRNEHKPTIAYAYDQVFGPTTTTRHVYDVAAQHVVSGVMEGINGTIFAYGVTSSGKTHSMLGDQRSPGIIPLAVKDTFSIIQETPNREYLLRVSYLEIYNEVINDLLNPAGQNLRIRDDAQGTFIEGIKEEVVLSPAHALSLIAAGEEHRHVGSTNFNLQSSRSHTIFTLTIESSPYNEEGAVNLSQLNLIDLAGSESSKAETTGVRHKEGSYINKSLLTLGTVISKLTDGRATHIPYTDSKLTRLLQSSLSGHGRVSLICTVTPASSNSEETHNTLKFAHRAKHIEIQAAHNKIVDEKSLIKKYQHEIHCLKEELEQLKRGVVTVTQKDIHGDDTVLLKQKLEDGQIKLQSRLEQEEEEAKAALLGRIQRLTKLILVSSKSSQSSSFSHHACPRRRHSFGEEELAYLPLRRRDLLDDENNELYVPVEGKAETSYDNLIEEKKTKKHGLLNWLKIRKRDSGLGTMTSTSDKVSGVILVSRPSTQAESSNFQVESRLSRSLIAESCPSVDISSEGGQDKEVSGDHITGQETPLASLKTFDQIDLLREQQNILSGEVELHLNSLKRLSEDAARYPHRSEIQVEMSKLSVEVKRKNEQIALLEKQIAESIVGSESNIDKFEISESIAELTEELNEKSFELEVKDADNRIIQEQLNQKVCEIEGLHELIASLKQQLSDAQQFGNLSPVVSSQRFTGTQSSNEEFCIHKDNTVQDDSNGGLLLKAQAAEIVELKQKVERLTDAKVELELENQKLVEESSYAKGLASAAAVELKALSEEVAKLMDCNERLAAELAAAKSSPTQRRNSGVTAKNGRRESQVKRQDQGGSPTELKRELAMSRKREFAYESAIVQKDQREAELQRRVEESEQREAYLEDELANMWVLVSKLKRSLDMETDVSDSGTNGIGIGNNSTVAEDCDLLWK